MYDTIFLVKCRICGTEYKIECYAKDYADWQKDKLIQDAFPYLSRDDRELLQTRTCGNCWEKYLYE